LRERLPTSAGVSRAGHEPRALEAILRFGQSAGLIDALDLTSFLRRIGSKQNCVPAGSAGGGLERDGKNELSSASLLDQQDHRCIDNQWERFLPDPALLWISGNQTIRSQRGLTGGTGGPLSGGEQL